MFTSSNNAFFPNLNVTLFALIIGDKPFFIFLLYYYLLESFAGGVCRWHRPLFLIVQKIAEFARGSYVFSNEF